MIKLKFYQSTIASKIKRFICLVSSETITKFKLESQLRILDTEFMFDPVTQIDLINLK